MGKISDDRLMKELDRLSEGIEKIHGALVELMWLEHFDNVEAWLKLGRNQSFVEIGRKIRGVQDELEKMMYEGVKDYRQTCGEGSTALFLQNLKEMHTQSYKTYSKIWEIFRLKGEPLPEPSPFPY